MTESLEEASQWLAALDWRQRAYSLAILGHELTVVARVLAHSDASEGVRVEQLRQLNEIQHRVQGYLIHALGDDENTNWIRPVLAFVFMPDDPEVRRLATWAWEESARRLRPSV